MNYYNEIELSARRWLRELIRDGLIPDGFIDNRPIQEVQAEELLREGFTQCHFFAGIGGWPLALRIAGVPDDEELWTGSCPCQPFSGAGPQMGNADSRHLFPTWRKLIARCAPAVVFGEQVASGSGREWFARVRVEMASLGYATRGADLCSAGVSAPNRRQRIFFMANTSGDGLPRRLSKNEGRAALAVAARLPAGGLGNADDTGWEGRRLRSDSQPGELNPWASGVIGLICADGKMRRIKPEIFPLAPRLPGDLGLIRGAGNAINPWIAAEFIKATYE